MKKIRRTFARVGQKLLPTSAAKGKGKKVVEPDTWCAESPQRVRQNYLRTLGIHKQGPLNVSGSTLLHPQPKTCSQPLLGLPFEERGSGLEDGSSVSCSESSMSSTAYQLESGMDDFRVEFLKKLSYSGIWVPRIQRPPRSQTVVIFDWDDTLLCTSCLYSFGAVSVPYSVRCRLHDIATVARELLETASRFGRTFIITNAAEGWVQESAARWVPGLLPVLRQVDVISARSRYEAEFPDVHQWKIQAFMELRRQLDSQAITNLISIGDSNFEMDAVRIMGSQFARALVKTVKFQSDPTPQDLFKELTLLQSRLEQVVQMGQHLQLRLDRRKVSDIFQTSIIEM